MEKVAEGALIEALDAGLVTVDEVELGAGGEGLESAGEAGGFIAGRLSGEGVVEDLFFEGPNAAEAPTGGGHFIEEALLDGAGGSEAGDVLILQLAEAGR